MKRTTILGFCFTALVALAVWAPNVLAYSNHSDCRSCHSITNNNTRHAFHKGATADLGVSCNICHDNNQVASSCAVCHDPAPLQTNHIDNYGQASCEVCHPQSPPTPTCIDGDGDGFGDPGNSSCGSGSSARDCDDLDAGVNPDATELCADGIDNDCNGQVDCFDSYCAGDSVCWAVNCIDYGKDRAGCKADPRCNYSGKKGCQDIDPAQLDCQDTGGRWNKKKRTCTYR